MVELFLEYGANPNVVKEGEETTLIRAIRMKLGLDVIQRLVEAGADPNAEGHFGNALHYAARLKDKTILKYLKAHGAKNAYATKRGLETEERDQTAILVQADIDTTTQALAEQLPNAEHHANIQNKTVHTGEECYVVYQLTDHTWTHIHPAKAKRGESIYGPDLAKKLSKKLATKAIFYENDDSAAYTGYALFEKGKRIEDVFLGSADLEACFQWKPGPHDITDEDEDLLRARSTRRELSPEDLEDDDFFDRFFRDEDAYLPAWSERDFRIGKTRKYFGKLDPEIFARVDFVRKA